MNRKKLLHTFSRLPNIIEKAKIVLKYIVIVILFGIFIAFVLSVLLFVAVFALNYRWNEALYVFGSTIGLIFLLTLALISVRKAVKMAFSDPNDINYERKTDKELFTFVAQSCIVAFVFAIISFQILIYIAILYWFYFIIFMLMFSRVWKFHGKKRIHLFAVLLITTVASFIAAPVARAGISRILNFFNIY